MNGAKVIVLEKSEKFGGNTALSGGQVWIPNNSFERRAGIEDDGKLAVQYLKHLGMGRVEDYLIKAFVKDAPHALDFVIANSPYRPVWLRDLPDYHPEWQGGCKGGRTVDSGLFDGDRLGAELRNIRHNNLYHFDGKHVSSMEFDMLMKGEPVPELKKRKPSVLGMGEALAGSLRKGLLLRKIPLLLKHRVTKLVREGSKIAGVEVLTTRGKKSIKGKAVILAAGGFEWNPAMKKQFLMGPDENSAGSPSNTGDGIRMGMKVGASVALLDQAWWFTLILKPGEKRGWLAVTERTYPGSLMVNREGKRFANEAMNYNDLTRIMLTPDPSTYQYANIPAFLILDSHHRERYAFAGEPPGKELPWLKKAGTLAELAKLLGVDSINLETTVKRFNQNASKGVDPEFHRGESLFDKHRGDSSAGNPTLGPLLRPPFYGVRVLAGDIGTKGGLKTNGKAQVLDAESKVIPGLYAVGNNMASVTGPGYAASGSTLGPCITFGYIAGLEASNHL
jgi:succinate dehydrogenase/fumarate reductase flavoprotein subunit